MTYIRRLIVSLILIISILLAPFTTLRAQDLLKVHFLDVGQGQSALFKHGDDVILIDGGGQGRSDFVVAYLLEQEITKVDLMVATHFDEDHIAGLIGVMNVFPVSKVLMGTDPSDTRVSQSFLRHVEGIETIVPAMGDTYTVGAMELEIKGPRQYGNSDHNDDSIISRVLYGENAFLIGGDTNADAEQQLLWQDLEADVMLANHHGSKGSNSRTWLEAIAPDHIVISCGEDNPYGHPGESVLGRVAQTNANLYRTDQAGTIIFTSDGQDVTVSGGIPLGLSMALVEPPVVADVEAAAVEQPPVTEVVEQPIITEAVEQPIITEAEAGNERDYILNTNSKKFHYPGCHSVKRMKEHNKYYLTAGRDEIIVKGYSPCGNCNP